MEHIFWVAKYFNYFLAMPCIPEMCLEKQSRC